MYDIDMEMERRTKIWNERFKGLLKDNQLTQAGFAEELNKRYNTKAYSQKTVNRWMHISEPGKGGLKSFPEYETMLRIADYFHVEIGYLTGETDGKSYDAQKTADYLRLSIEAIDSIKQVTDRSSSRGKTTISRKPRPMLASRMYEKLLTAEGFYPFLAQMEELDMEYNSPLTKKEQLDHIADGKNPEIYKKVSKYIGYAFEPDEDPGFSDEELAAYQELDDAVDAACEEERSREVYLDFLRFTLLKEYEKLVADLYPE